MEMRLGTTRIRIHPLMMMMPMLALMTGMREELLALSLALSVHELAHLLAARWMHVRVEQLRLMPFGGAADIGNPYALSAVQQLVTSLAGPLANLLSLFICAALTHWRVLSPMFALQMLQANLILMLFNLLPALPLDGGRALYALLSPVIGRERAVETGILMGRILAGLMLALSLYIWITRGLVNLSLIFAAIFILAAAPEERRALCTTRVQTMLSELKPISNPIPAHICAVSDQCSIQTALRAARPSELTLYAVYADDKLVSFTDDRRLLNAALEKSVDASIADV